MALLRNTFSLLFSLALFIDFPIYTPEEKRGLILANDHYSLFQEAN